MKDEIFYVKQVYANPPTPPPDKIGRGGHNFYKETVLSKQFFSTFILFNYYYKLCSGHVWTQVAGYESSPGMTTVDMLQLPMGDMHLSAWDVTFLNMDMDMLQLPMSENASLSYGYDPPQYGYG